MAANHSLDEIRQYLRADSLHYLSQEGMVQATGHPREAFCLACYDGKYPVPYDTALDKMILDKRREAETLGAALAREMAQMPLLRD